MPERPANVRSELKIRLPEKLRAQLEVHADAAGYSLNSEIVRRLEQSLRDQAMGGTVFGDNETFAIVDEFVRILRAIEMTADRHWNDGTLGGAALLAEAFGAMQWLIEHGPALLAGQPLPMLRELHAKVGFEALRAMITNDLKRRQERDDAAPQGEAGAKAEGEAA